ncbi:flagellar basal body rod protein FlgB [Tepidibacter formicigenes]|jgi:flagellar basal-body rod protein FlgB|uniref:Flagellar basal body rod protein FlgB n=1 Tax=Tepidibacter formicigenes DSM 15518 TaxID=1123349 RepID=A0A1M6J8K8_9FIRM|nr:flagellar basal body rod protein FlgB [Tepidibacter formicigenes]SHJ43029.1 flagellar basal-body rod protein FlgB [Tepidibacter formicigenes DSM 15518]
MKITNNIELLSKGLNAYSLKHEVITNNISNANTPNYKRKDVQFDEILKKSLQNNKSVELCTTNQKHIKMNSDSIKPKIITSQNTKSRLDGNNVDIDVEMAQLTKNYIKYSVISQQISGLFRRIKNAISEGSR